MKRFIMGMTAVLTTALTLSSSALAMPIHIEEGAVSLSARAVSDGEGVALELEDFQIIGRDRSDYLIYAGDRLLSVSEDDFQSVLDAVGDDAGALRDIEDYDDIGRGSGDASVAALQEALIALGYLGGQADGDFGGNSQRAVFAFQRDMGLEQTGVADALTQMLVYSTAAEPLEINPITDTRETFAPILGKTADDLSAAMALGMWLKYDDIAGEGEISNGNALVYEAPALSDIDRCTYTVRAVLNVGYGEDGALRVRPALKLECLCVRRPVMQEIIVKSGDARETLQVEDLDSALSGVQSLEKGTIWLDAGALEILAGAAEAGELKLRVASKYGSCDIEASESALKLLSDVAQAAQSL